jgi:hypothetical protein
MPTRRKKKTPEETEAPEESKAPEGNEPEENEPEENAAPEEPEEAGQKVVSLGRELAILGLAVRTAQIAADVEAYGFMDEDMEATALHGVSSVLALVGARMDLVQAVIRREVNPAVLWSPHNAVGAHEIRVDEDVLLPEWSRA